MNNVYNLVLKNFFKNNQKFNNKSFLIDANDDILLDKNDESKISSGVYFKLYLSKVSKDNLIDYSMEHFFEKSINKYFVLVNKNG